MRELLGRQSPRFGARSSPGHQADNLFHHTSHQVFLATVLATAATLWVHGVLYNGGAVLSHAPYVGFDLLLAIPFAGVAVWAGGRLANRLELGKGLLVRGALAALVFTALFVPLAAVQSVSHAAIAGGAAGTAGHHHAAADAAGVLGYGLSTAAMVWPAVLVAALVAVVGMHLTTRQGRRMVLARVRALPRPMLVASSATALVAGIGAAAFLPATPAAAQTGSCATAPQRVFNVVAINVEITVNRHGDYDPWGFMYVLEHNLPDLREEEEQLRNASATGTRLDENGTQIDQDPDWAEMVYDDPDARFVSHGLRNDLIQPLVIRGRLGECVVINLRNDLTRAPVGGVSNNNARLHEFPGGAPAVSIDMQGVSYDAAGGDGGQDAGNNTASMVDPGQTGQFRFYLDPAMQEGTKVFRSGGESSQLTAHGLFGALIAEPAGSRWFDPMTGVERTGNLNDPASQWSNWEAMIQPGDGQPTFREFAILYHEIGDENFSVRRPLREAFGAGGGSPREDPFEPGRIVGGALPMLDVQDPSADGNGTPRLFFQGGGTKAYRPGARALNYRSESFFRRLQHEAILVAEQNGTADDVHREQVDNKSLGYSSYIYGDPATPMPRSYLGEPTKTRLAHVGFEQLHVHHLHGGATRWRQNPGADDTRLDSGLDKFPLQDAQSIRLDSQTISPEESFSLEHECGAGGCQQAAGDFLYHCHIAHHYVAGMWSFWRVFDTDHSDPSLEYPLAPLPGANAPPAAVNSIDLIGNVLQDGRTVVDQVTDPNTQVGIRELATGQLPPSGVRLDKQDATVWNWTIQETANGPLILGEPEDTRIWENYRAESPGTRPAVRFNPTNGRPAFPLFTPQLAQRPPFSPNEHSGAPWLGDTGSAGRPDGLCPAAAQVREYNITAVSVPIQMTDRELDTGGMLYTLNEDLEDLVSGNRSADPLVIRSNVGDCVAITFGNDIDNEARAADPNLDELAKTNMHTHFVQFDPLASDGVITGFSYEQSIFPAQREGRTLVSVDGPSSITVNHVNRLRPGIAIAVGLGTPEIEIRTIAAINGNQLTFDRPLVNSHDPGVWVTVEFTRHRWYSDVDSGTIFWHDHVDGIISWAHGLFAAHVIEPAGSTYHDPVTGAQVRSGTIVDIRNNNPNASVGVGQSGSFREFVIFLHNGRHASQARLAFGGQLQFAVNQECEEASINLRAEPLGERTPMGTLIGAEPNPSNVDPTTTDQRFEYNGYLACRTGYDRSAPSRSDVGTTRATVTTVDPYVFSSVTYGDPATPLLRAYAGDDVVIRTIGLGERGEALRFQGHQFRMERFNADAQLMDTAVTGISERYDYVLDGGAGGPDGIAGDYLYHSTRQFALETGGWGIFRVHDTLQTGPTGLQPLPDNPVGNGQGFPILTPNTAANPQANPGGAPPVPSSAVVSDNRQVCPSPGQIPLIYSITVFEHTLPTAPFEDTEGVVFALTSDVVDIQNGVKPVEPLVLRANEGDCVIIRLRNRLDPNPLTGSLYGGSRAGFDLGMLARNPQLSSGGAIGLNPDTTVAAGQNGEYRFRALQTGSTMFSNIGSPASVRHGAYGMFIVEPAGSSWTDGVTGQPLGATRTSTHAVINPADGPAFREFALTLHTTDQQYSRSVVRYFDVVAGSGVNSPRTNGGQHNVPGVGNPGLPIAGAPPGTENTVGSWNKGFTHVSYNSAPLTERIGLTRCPGHVGDNCRWWNLTAQDDFLVDHPYGTTFSSQVHGDPDTPVFPAHTGDRVVFRVGVGGSDQLHSFIVSGHSFPLEPDMDGAQEMSTRTVTTRQSLDVWLTGGAGDPGDYIYRDSRQPFTAAGLWGIFRVLPSNTPGITPVP